MDNTSGTNSWASANSVPVRDFYNFTAKSVDAADVPQSLVVSYIYELPSARARR